MASDRSVGVGIKQKNKHGGWPGLQPTLAWLTGWLADDCSYVLEKLAGLIWGLGRASLPFSFWARTNPDSENDNDTRGETQEKTRRR